MIMDQSLSSDQVAMEARNFSRPLLDSSSPPPTRPPLAVLSDRHEPDQITTSDVVPTIGVKVPAPTHARTKSAPASSTPATASGLPQSFPSFRSLWSARRPSTSSSSSSVGSAQTRYSAKSFRSTSSHSPLYMFKNAMTSGKQLPYEQPSLTDEQFEVFAKLTSDQQLVRKPGTWMKVIGRGIYFVFIICFIYFFLVGKPIWDGALHWFWRFYNGELVEHSIWGMFAFIIAGTHRNILPQLLCTFDRGIPGSEPETPRDASECCIVIPCYKAAETLRATIPACLKIFRPEQVFVIANGNSPTPLDHTADVCAEFGVRHFWVPVGSKITAEFVGVAVAREYKYVMLIDDDVLLPENLPLPTHHFDDCDAKNRVACVGYTIKSVGTNSSRGTLMQQAQDLEYKVSGLAKVLQTHYGSVVFPHGAIALWRRDVLEKIFHAHPGYHISEDWYLGHTARAAGYRMVMSSQIFVETETPPGLFPPMFKRKDGGSRGGYGEMTIYKQRFYRWNFFFLFRIYNNLMYILLSWRLGWREIITKIYVFGECYDSLIRLIAPVVMPIALVASWRLTLIVTGSLLLVNWGIILFFNLVHLGLLRRGRPDNEQVPWIAFFPYIWLKFAMVWVNVASVYWSIYEYAFFFTQQHLMVTENVLAWQVIRESHRNTVRVVAVDQPAEADTQPHEKAKTNAE